MPNTLNFLNFLKLLFLFSGMAEASQQKLCFLPAIQYVGDFESGLVVFNH